MKISCVEQFLSSFFSALVSVELREGANPGSPGNFEEV